MIAQNSQRAVVELLERGIAILDAKRHDYANDDDFFSNFRFTGMCLDFAIDAGLRGPDLAFLALITTKLARMIALRGGNKDAKNEPISNTCVDGSDYFALWGGFLKEEIDKRVSGVDNKGEECRQNN